MNSDEGIAALWQLLWFCMMEHAEDLKEDTIKGLDLKIKALCRRMEAAAEAGR